MTWEEIERQYKGEWVLVEVTKISEDYEVLEGNILCHDADEEAFKKKAKVFRPKVF